MLQSKCVPMRGILQTTRRKRSTRLSTLARLCYKRRACLFQNLGSRSDACGSWLPLFVRWDANLVELGIGTGGCEGPLAAPTICRYKHARDDQWNAQNNTAAKPDRPE